jgi:hypothetical protein
MSSLLLMGGASIAEWFEARITLVVFEVRLGYEAARVQEVASDPFVYVYERQNDRVIVPSHVDNLHAASTLPPSQQHHSNKSRTSANILNCVILGLQMVPWYPHYL